MSESSIISLQDRLIADVFQKSYREFLLIKPTHYKWNYLAPQTIEYLKQAQVEFWSIEKVADYLHCEVEEAIDCQRRFSMSQKINSKNTTATKIHQGIVEWLGGIADLDEKTKNNFADELSKILANQLFLAAQGEESLLKVSRDLEGAEDSISLSQNEKEIEDKPKNWGPQWKD